VAPDRDPQEGPDGPGTGSGPPRRISASSNDARLARGHQEVRTLATATKLRASTTKLRPLGDRVIVKPTAREEMTKSGIVLPDTAKEKPQEGTILAVGPGRILDDGKREQVDLKEGQKVLYAKYSGTEFKIDDEELLIVGFKDVLAVVES
jgi:chaperonin GroES